MGEQAVDQRGGLAVRLDQPLIGVILHEDHERVVRYFADEAAADAAIPERATQPARAFRRSGLEAVGQCGGAWPGTCYVQRQRGDVHDAEDP